jgi:hypothetical protein
MKNNNLITKIALGVAVAALIFSIVTFIRSLVIGANVLLGAILVIGTTIIVIICAVMLYYLRAYDDAEDDTSDTDDAADSEDSDEPADADEASESAAEAPSAESADDIEAEVDSLIADLESDRSYDLRNFE